MLRERELGEIPDHFTPRHNLDGWFGDRGPTVVSENRDVDCNWMISGVVECLALTSSRDHDPGDVAPHPERLAGYSRRDVHQTGVCPVTYGDG